LNYKIASYFIFYLGKFQRIHVIVTDGYYKSGEKNEPIITKAVNFKFRTDPNFR
jgi:hypothetical protein